LIQESLIYRLITGIFALFKKLGQDSFIMKILRRCGVFLRTLFSNSAIVCFAVREGAVNRSYEDSVLYKMTDGLIRLPQKILHPVLKKAESVLSESIVFRVLTFLLDRLHLLAGGFLFIALVVPYKYWNNWYSAIAMIVLCFLYFLRTIVKGRTNFQTSAFNVFLVLFMICVLLAQIFSIMPDASQRFLVFYLTCFLMVFILIAVIRTKEELMQVLNKALAGLTVAGIYGLYQYIIKVPVNPAWIDTKVNQGNLTRVYSFFNNPNDFAEVILIFLPFYCAAFFNTKNVFARLVYLAMAVPPVLSMLMTLSRGAWVALAIAAVVYVFFKEKRMIPVLILLGFAAIPFLPQSILLRLRTMMNPADSSYSTRTEIWKTVIPIIKDYWLTGLGLGNETLLKVSKNYYVFVSKGSIPSHSHNLYLQIWIEMGIFGITSFLAFILSTVKKSIKSLVTPEDDGVKNVLIAGLASLAGILANGMIEYVWFDRRVMLFFWVAVGIILAAMAIRARADHTNDLEAAKERPEPSEKEVA